MVDSIRKQLQYPADGVNITCNYLAVDKIIRNMSFLIICKTSKLNVSKVETNSQQQPLELVFVEGPLFG